MGDLRDNPSQEERVLKFVDELQGLADELAITIYVPAGNQLTLVDLENKQIVRLNITHEEEGQEQEAE